MLAAPGTLALGAVAGSDVAVALVALAQLVAPRADAASAASAAVSGTAVGPAAASDRPSSFDP